MGIVIRNVPRHDVQQASRHSEVNQQSASRIEPNNYILATTIDGDDSFSLEFGGDFEGVDGARQPRVEDLDAFEAAADEHGLQPAPDRFDLW